MGLISAAPHWSVSPITTKMIPYTQIGTNWAITAAHCLIKYFPKRGDQIDEGDGAYEGAGLQPGDKLALRLGVWDMRTPSEFTK